jgi:hypothetical protein
MGPNPLDAPPSITAVASLGAVGPPAVSAQPLGPSPPPPTAPLPDYSITQQPADALASGRWVVQPSVDVMASQTAACFREAGILLNGLPGGGAESVDLTPSARRVLHAQQMLLGTRAAGLVGPPTAPPPYPSPAPHARTQGLPDGVQQPSPYSAALRSKQRSGGAGSSGWPAEMLLALRKQSDSLCTPYWSGLLGSFSKAFKLQGCAVPAGFAV